MQDLRGRVRGGTIRVRSWLDRDRQQNYATLRFIADMFVMVVWFFVASGDTERVYRFLCSPLWTKDRCNDYVADNVYAMRSSFFIPVLVDAGLLWYARNGMKKQSPGAYRNFRRILFLHIYVTLLYVILAHAMVEFFVTFLLFASIGLDIWILRKFWDKTSMGDREVQQVNVPMIVPPPQQEGWYAPPPRPQAGRDDEEAAV
eukprot:TRINITY_DN81010_c0_g1_i1.p1 TRINITY_DN81010_c0_g1~~TRINITY_DN81010_c0_g1_i1.p1  ORF type:complete len:202 (+),score=46.80 TRINITY_DN81010_c0_g1_i1:239-844(+)